MRTLFAVDDNEAWLRTLTRWFAPLGYKIHTATNCHDAVNMMASIQPDCLLLDFNMQDGTAEDVCKFIRTSEKLKKIPIVIISSYGEEELTAHNQCQADAFIYKCTSLENIQGVVEGVLRRVGWERGIYEKGDVRLQASGRQVFRGANLIAELSSEHFLFFSALLEKSPEYVSEDAVCRVVLNSEFTEDKYDALKMMAYRLRQKLGAQLERRIKNKKGLGWIYVQPRLRSSEPVEDDPETDPA